MGKSIYNVLWQPKQKWQKLLYGGIALVAWTTMAISIVIGWFYKPVLIGCVVILGALGLLEVFMTAVSSGRSYTADEE
jgi:xanthine/uracil permease